MKAEKHKKFPLSGDPSLKISFLGPGARLKKCGHLYSSLLAPELHDRQRFGLGQGIPD